MKMKEMTLRDIQNMSLEILKDVHEFCMSHEIKYSLAYGTLLGAVRHKGFIPWDDDIDIMMPRSDFDRFCCEYQSQKFHVAVPGESYLAYGRVFDSEKTFIEHKNSPWFPKDTGVWIDVFPIDNVSDSHDVFLKDAKAIQEIWKKQFILRNLKLSIWTKPLTKQITHIVKSVFFRGKIENVVGLQLRMMKKDNCENTKHCSQLGCPDNVFKEYWNCILFSEYKFVTFCDAEFLMISKFDCWLKSVYCDYMSLPPVEQQIPKQDKSMKFYWK